MKMKGNQNFCDRRPGIRHVPVPSRSKVCNPEVKVDRQHTHQRDHRSQEEVKRQFHRRRIRGSLGEPHITIIRYLGKTASSKKKKSWNRSSEANTPKTLAARNIRKAKNSRGRSSTFHETITPLNTTSPAISSIATLMPSTPDEYEMPRAGSQSICSMN